MTYFGYYFSIIVEKFEPLLFKKDSVNIFSNRQGVMVLIITTA